MIKTTHIRIEPKIKKALDKKKIVSAESYSSVIERIIDENDIKQNATGELK